MGFLDKFKKAFNLDGGADRKNLVMGTESNREQVHEAHADNASPDHNAAYEEPRNRMMDTVSNDQLAQDMGAQLTTGDEYKDKMNFSNTLSNKEVEALANGTDAGPRANEMIDTRANDVGVTNTTNVAGDTQLGSERVR